MKSQTFNVNAGDLNISLGDDSGGAAKINRLGTGERVTCPLHVCRHHVAFILERFEPKVRYEYH